MLFIFLFLHLNSRGGSVSLASLGEPPLVQVAFTIILVKIYISEVNVTGTLVSTHLHT